MGIKAAIAEFKRVRNEPERFDVYMLGELVGTATDYAQSMEDEDTWTFYWGFYPRSPVGIFPIGDIVVNWDGGEIYMFNGKEGDDTVVDMEKPVSLIEAIAKEL